MECSVYLNGTNEAITHNGTEIPAFTVLHPDGSTINLQDYNGIEDIHFEGTNQSDYVNAEGYKIYMLVGR